MNQNNKLKTQAFVIDQNEKMVSQLIFYGDIAECNV